MKYRLLGKSGLRVSELCLGCGTFGVNWGPIGSDFETSRSIFDAFVKRGGNFLDTSNRYQEGQSEEYLAEMIASDRDYFVIGSKYSLFDKFVRLSDPNGTGNNRKNMMRSVEGSLQRLKTDYIDVLWVHAWDYMTPVEEVMRGMDDLVRSGKVHYIGFSNVPAWITSQANMLAQFHGWSPVVASQIEYNLVERTAEREYIPMSLAFDMAVVCWSALSGGMLTGKYNKDFSTSSEQLRLRTGFDPSVHPKWVEIVKRNQRIMERVLPIAQEIGRPAVQVALRWLIQQKPVTIPIFSARTLEQAEEDLGCLDWTLTTEQMQQIDEATEEALTTPIYKWGYPHDFLEYGSPAITDFDIKKMLYGDTIDDVINHRQLK